MAYVTVKISAGKLESLIERSDKNVTMVAADLGVAQGTVWRWLKKGGEVGVSPRVFQQMLAVFNVPAEELKVGEKFKTLRLSAELYANLEALAKSHGGRTIVQDLERYVDNERIMVSQRPASGDHGKGASRASRR